MIDWQARAEKAELELQGLIEGMRFLIAVRDRQLAEANAECQQLKKQLVEAERILAKR